MSTRMLLIATIAVAALLLMAAIVFGTSVADELGRQITPEMVGQ